MMTGHGHVTPNPDGSKARCGGPAICSQCALEYARKMLSPQAICGIVSNSGPYQEPLACGYPPGHEGHHSWATLPTWETAR